MTGGSGGGTKGGALCGLLVAATCAAAGEDPAPERFQFTRVRMGVPFNITVYADDEAAASAAADAAYARVKELNAVFSDYDPRSETSRLARDLVPGRPLPVSRDMLAMLERARGYSEASGGAFDVTVGPVVKLWRRAKRMKTKPTPEELNAARSLVGFEAVRLDPEASTVTFDRPGMQLDFGGIAAGYACDEAVRIFQERGLPRVLVEASGDIACGDPPPGKEGWTVAVGDLDPNDPAAERHITVANRGVTTSGDAYQFIEFDGVRYSHIVDPRTGLGLTTRSTVTVAAGDATAADALASAVSVLGPEKGLALIERTEGAEVLMVYVAPDGVTRTVKSSGFDALLAE